MKRRIFAAILISAFSYQASATAVSIKAREKKQLLMSYFVFLEVPMRNFGTKDEKEKFTELKKKYSSALSFFFEDEFFQAYKIFLEILDDTEKLFEDISSKYIADSAELLSDSMRKVVDISIKYHKNSQRVKRFMREIDITRFTQENVKDQRSYLPKDYHFTYDNKVIVDNLDLGFAKIGHAKRLRQKAIDFAKSLEPGKKVPVTMKVTRIELYMAVIRLCRAGKQNGIKVFQLSERHRQYDGQPKYMATGEKDADKRAAKEKYHYREVRLNPVFDLRVPEKYLIHASDNYNRIHEEEQCLKLDQKIPRDCEFMQDDQDSKQ